MKALLLLTILILSLDTFAGEDCSSSVQLRDHQGNIISLCLKDQGKVISQNDVLSKLETGRELMDREEKSLQND